MVLIRLAREVPPAILTDALVEWGYRRDRAGDGHWIDGRTGRQHGPIEVIADDQISIAGAPAGLVVRAKDLRGGATADARMRRQAALELICRHLEIDPEMAGIPALASAFSDDPADEPGLSGFRLRSGIADDSIWSPAAFWDARAAAFFLRERARADPLWPGDEVRPARHAKELVEALVKDASAWRRVIELGPGAGRSTAALMNLAPRASIMAMDVSEAALAMVSARFPRDVADGCLKPVRLESRKADEMLSAAESIGWVGEADAVVAFDCLCHADLQVVVVYVLCAALVLRPGGMFAANFADVTSDAGFAKLLGDTAPQYSRQSVATDRFEWVSPDIVELLLATVGFRVERIEQGPTLGVVASLTRPELAHVLKHRIGRS